MSAENDRAEQGDAAIKCRRTGQTYDLSTCTRCPYCFGDNADVASADPASFCDFHPGGDPVCFGFPGNDARTQRG
jgi:hypothetical protein